MQHSRTRFLLCLFSLVVCFALSGCEPGYPYYTTEGSMEARTVVIHYAEGKSETVPIGTGMGAGLTEEQKGAAMSGAEVIVEKGSAKVTVIAKGASFLVKQVTYDGKDAKAHEPVL